MNKFPTASYHQLLVCDSITASWLITRGKLKLLRTVGFIGFSWQAGWLFIRLRQCLALIPMKVLVTF
jgi:hypothetical protein